MSTEFDYDVAVIGSGPAGYVAAIRASQMGQKTCLVEKADLGGVCTNVGCIPTKVLSRAAYMALRLRAAGELGLQAGEVKVDYPALARRRDRIVNQLRSGIGSLLKANHVEVIIPGLAAFEGPRALKVRSDGQVRKLSARRFIVATGSRPAELPGIPFDHQTVIDSSDAVLADEVPESVLIVGAGYIGVEFATIYAVCGAEVTVVEALDRILPAMDADCGREVAKALNKLGAKLHTGTTIQEAKISADSVKARLSNGKSVAARKMLVCVGRRPDCSELQVENAGLKPDHRGALPVNEHMQTSQPHIYAAGDVVGGPMLAHVASHQALVAAHHAAGKITAAMDYRVVPACVFAQPEVGTVGLTEQEAQKVTDKVIVKKFPLRALGKAHVIGELDGFVKIVADGATGELLGVHIVGPEASALIGEAALALKLECTAEELADTIHAHPTLPEALREAADGALGMPINWLG